jgi:predicted phage tail protein
MRAVPASAGEVQVTWTDRASNETGYEVQNRAGSETSWYAVATLPANAESYRSTGLTAGTLYTFRVHACNPAGCSAWSDEVSVTATAPAAPSGLAAAPAGSGQVTLTWTDNSSDETGFELDYRLPGEVLWTGLARVAANVTTYAHTGLTAGLTYTYRVRACAAAGCSAYAAEAAATVAAPAPPTGLTARAVGSGRIDLAWQDNSGDETGFAIEYREGTSTWWYPLVTTASNVTTYSHLGLKAGAAVAYRVRSCSAAGCSEPTPEVQAVAGGPRAPTQLSASPAGSGRVDLRWQDNSDDETSFAIEYREGTSTWWYPLASVPANATTFSHTGLSSGATFTYRVRACNASGCSDAPDEVQATAGGPASPSALTATAAGSGRVELAWTDNSSDETSFRVEYREGTSAWWYTLASTPANVRTYTHTGLQAGDTYAYRVRACNDAGCSGPTAEAQAVVQGPAAPGPLTATPVGSGRIDLAWQDNSADETSFQVQAREAASASWWVEATLPGGTRAYVHRGLVAGTSYVYRVAACNASGCSAFSNEARATAAGPAAPTQLTALGRTGEIALSWRDESTDEDYFDLQWRSPASSVWSPLFRAPAGTTTYTHTGLQAGDAYVYRVFACNTSGCSASSNQASATVPTGTGGGGGDGSGGTSPAAPVTVLPGNGQKEVSLRPTFSWTSVAGATAYRVMVAPGSVALPSNKDENLCGACTINTEVTGTSLKASPALAYGGAYHWQVKARTAAGWTAWSGVSTLTTAPGSVYCPSGWTVVGSGRGVVVCSADLSLSGGTATQYVVEVDLQRGAQVINAYRALALPTADKPSPQFDMHTVGDWWDRAVGNPNRFCALNGVPFKSYFFRLLNDTTSLSYPLRTEGTLATTGSEMGDIDRAVLFIAADHAWIEDYTLPGGSGSSLGTVEQRLSGARTAIVAQGRSLGAATPDGQTYAAVRDGDDDNSAEVLLFYVTEKATRSEVNTILITDFHVGTGPASAVDLDGGASSQLRCVGTGFNVDTGQFDLRAVGKRPVPHALLVTQAP